MIDLDLMAVAIKCKECRARRTQEERKVKKAPEVQRKPSVKVYSAVQRGFRTREQIEAETGLHEDEVADSLAVLCFVSKTVRIKRVGESKFFVPINLAA